MTVGDLYETYATPIMRHARRLTADIDNADDLFQETFIRAMKNLSLLGSLSPHKRRVWLYRTMGNLFIDKQRARQREMAFLSTLQQIIREETGYRSGGLGFNAGYHESESVSITDILRRVPKKDHDLFHMRFVLGMTSGEIATRTDIPASTIRYRLHVAIKNLRAWKSRLV